MSEAGTIRQHANCTNLSLIWKFVLTNGVANMSSSGTHWIELLVSMSRSKILAENLCKMLKIKSVSTTVFYYIVMLQLPMFLHL